MNDLLDFPFSSLYIDGCFPAQTKLELYSCVMICVFGLVCFDLVGWMVGIYLLLAWLWTVWLCYSRYNAYLP